MTDKSRTDKMIKGLRDLAETGAISEYYEKILWQAHYYIADSVKSKERDPKPLRVRRAGYMAEYNHDGVIDVILLTTNKSCATFQPHGRPSESELYAAIEKVLHKAHCKQFE